MGLVKRGYEMDVYVVRSVSVIDGDLDSWISEKVYLEEREAEEVLLMDYNDRVSVWAEEGEVDCGVGDKNENGCVDFAFAELDGGDRTEWMVDKLELEVTSLL